MEQLFSDTGKQATQDFEPWEKDTPQVSSMIDLFY